MDNDDEGIFSSPKSLIGIAFLGCVSLYVLYWIYVNIIKDTQPNSNTNNKNGRNSSNNRSQSNTNTNNVDSNALNSLRNSIQH